MRQICFPPHECCSFQPGDKTKKELQDVNGFISNESSEQPSLNGRLVAWRAPENLQPSNQNKKKLLYLLCYLCHFSTYVSGNNIPTTAYKKRYSNTQERHSVLSVVQELAALPSQLILKDNVIQNTNENDCVLTTVLHNSTFQSSLGPNRDNSSLLYKTVTES